MWLIDARNWQMRSFPDSNGRTPPYVILSHVWGHPEDESTFTDFTNEPFNNHRFNRTFKKVGCFIHFARRAGHDWIWLDTCCIDKSSSTELSEAINSMWIWYRAATVCYALLPDVNPDEDPGVEGSSFRRSKWFERGWTLQELLAPKKVIFLGEGPLDPDWVEITLQWPLWVTNGTLDSLAQVVHEITNIDIDILVRTVHLGDVSVAKKLSWAARRRTTRVEDRAYSLIGIFGVHLPTIYGEGEKAFTRLQLEILRQFPDQTVFAWGKLHSYHTLKHVLTAVDEFGPGPEWAWDFRGLFASSPATFEPSAQICAVSNRALSSMLEVPLSISDFSPTQAGVRMHLPFHDFTHPKLGSLRLVFLACEDAGDPIVLLLHATPHTVNQYHVGLYAHNATPSAPWYPAFRIFRVPRMLVDRGVDQLIRDLHRGTMPAIESPIVRPSIAQRILRRAGPPDPAQTLPRLRTADMYVHSHNPAVDRSLQQKRTEKRTGAASRSSKRPSRGALIVVFPRWVEIRLYAAGFELSGRAGSEWVRRKPPSNPDFAFGAKLALRPRECMVLLFRNPSTSEAFALVAGIGESLAVWGTVLFFFFFFGLPFIIRKGRALW